MFVFFSPGANFPYANWKEADSGNGNIVNPPRWGSVCWRLPWHHGCQRGWRTAKVSTKTKQVTLESYQTHQLPSNQILLISPKAHKNNQQKIIYIIFYPSNPTRSILITYQIHTQIHQDTSDSVKLEVSRCVALQTNLEVGVNHLFRESPVVEPPGLPGKWRGDTSDTLPAKIGKVIIQYTPWSRLTIQFTPEKLQVGPQ